MTADLNRLRKLANTDKDALKRLLEMLSRHGSSEILQWMLAYHKKSLEEIFSTENFDYKRLLTPEAGVDLVSAMRNFVFRQCNPSYGEVERFFQPLSRTEALDILIAERNMDVGEAEELYDNWFELAFYLGSPEDAQIAWKINPGFRLRRVAPGVRQLKYRDRATKKALVFMVPRFLDKKALADKGFGIENWGQEGFRKMEKDYELKVGTVGFGRAIIVAGLNNALKHYMCFPRGIIDGTCLVTDSNLLVSHSRLNFHEDNENRLVLSTTLPQYLLGQKWGTRPCFEIPLEE